MSRHGARNALPRLSFASLTGRRSFRERPHRAAWELLASSFRGRRRELGGLAAWLVVEALPAYLSGRLVALATDQGFLARDPERGFAWLGLLGCALVLGAWSSRQIYRRLATIVEPFRDELVARTVAGALGRSTATGAPADTAGVARLTLQVELAREAYGGSLMAVQEFVVKSGAALLGLLSLSPVLLVLVLVPLVLGVGVFLGGLRTMSERREACLTADERIAERATAMASGLRDVVASGAEETVASSLEADIEDRAKATRALARTTALRTLGAASGGLAPLVLILAAGPWLVRHGASTGEILGALTYVLQGVLPAVQTLGRELGGTGLWLLVALDRIAATSATGPTEAASSAEERRTDPSGALRRFRSRRPHLALQGVTFRYGPWADPIVDGLNLDIEEGDHVAVVGPSGVGKSTLAGLMAGLLPPESGQILLGGSSLQDLDVGELSRHRVLIPQEAYVFAGSVEENLRYLDGSADASRVGEVVDLLGLEPLITRLGGYGSAVDPKSLSAGERQLLTLARAYLSPAELVILDEATCHLDPAAEARAELAFASRPGTLVVIAHRISSARRARRLLVMDGARVLDGTHEELTTASPLYRDLVGHWLSPTLAP